MRVFVILTVSIVLLGCVYGRPQVVLRNQPECLEFPADTYQRLGDCYGRTKRYNAPTRTFYCCNNRALAPGFEEDRHPSIHSGVGDKPECYCYTRQEYCKYFWCP